MVVLTIVAPSNRTVPFDHPIRKPNYIRLLSCSLYNSWLYLKQGGKMELKSKENPSGFYWPFYPQTLAKEIPNALLPYTDTLKTEINTPLIEITIYNTNGGHRDLDGNLASFLGIPKDRLKA